jgi:hypothetical protein
LSPDAPETAKTAPSVAKPAKKKTPKKGGGKSKAASGAGKAAKKSVRPYPARTLEEALKVPQAIREKNNGNPWATEDVAQASIGVKSSNNKFFYLAASARDYGLTIGTRNTEKIELAPLGREIVFAPDEETRRKKLLEAFFSIDIFKRVYDHYGSARLPEKEFLANVLQNDFGLDPEFHDEFAEIFVANCKFLHVEDGLTDDQKKTQKADRPDHTPEVRVIGEPKGKFDRTAFVVMPFVEKGKDPRPAGFFSEVLRSLITPAGNNAGFAVETASQDGSDVIQSTIINQLLTADLVIADLTDHNPNVLFELGIRIAKELPVALIKAEGTGPIFDVDNMMRVAPYSPNLWATSVAIDLPRLRDHIKAAWDNRSTARSYMQILTRVAA